MTISKNNGSSKIWVIVGIVVLAVLVLIFWGSASSKAKTNRELALSCTTDMLTQFHIHPHLSISIDGEQQAIPANVGMSGTCLHPIHTHDADGIIHVESPETRDFILGDFFAVWDKSFTKDQILDYAADASHTITMTVNGTSVDTYENTILRDEEQIVITYGPLQ